MTSNSVNANLWFEPCALSLISLGKKVKSPVEPNTSFFKELNSFGHIFIVKLKILFFAWRCTKKLSRLRYKFSEPLKCIFRFWKQLFINAYFSHPAKWYMFCFCHRLVEWFSNENWIEKAVHRMRHETTFLYIISIYRLSFEGS